MIKIHVLSHNREQSGSNTKDVNAANVSSKIRICSALNGQRARNICDRKRKTQWGGITAGICRGLEAWGGGGGSAGERQGGKFQELCESRGGRPGLLVPNKPDDDDEVMLNVLRCQLTY